MLGAAGPMAVGRSFTTPEAPPVARIMARASRTEMPYALATRRAGPAKAGAAVDRRKPAARSREKERMVRKRMTKGTGSNREPAAILPTTPRLSITWVNGRNGAAGLRLLRGSNKKGPRQGALSGIGATHANPNWKCPTPLWLPLQPAMHSIVPTAPLSQLSLTGVPRLVPGLTFQQQRAWADHSHRPAALLKGRGDGGNVGAVASAERQHAREPQAGLSSCLSPLPLLHTSSP